MSEADGQLEPRIVITELDELLAVNDLRALAGRSIDELRQLRDRLGEIETGLSFARRMAQGRLDILLGELGARALPGDGAGDGLGGTDVLGRLPDVLSGQSRTMSQPRPVRDVEIPAFADEILAPLDQFITPSQLADLATLDDETIRAAADRITAYEQAISRRRLEVHRIVDEVQEEIIGRYRSGALTVDDLLN